jgi:hypothetical protein
MIKTTVPDVEVTAVCHDCRLQHTYRVQPVHLVQALGEWVTKHQGHPIEFSRPAAHYESRLRRWIREFWADVPAFRPAWAAYGDNSDAKGAYVASADYTISLASLATSATRVAGRESTVVSNAVNKYLDYIISGKITEGTTPTVSKQIDLWAYCALKDTPTYPCGATGVDAALTIVSENQRNSGLVPLRSTLVDATTDRPYFFAPRSLAEAIGALMPMTHHGLFVTHDTAVALNATGGNHVLSYTPIYGTIT